MGITLYDYQEEFLDYFNNVLSFGIMFWKRASGKTFTGIYEIIKEMCDKSSFKVNIYTYGAFTISIMDIIVEMIKDYGKDDMIVEQHSRKLLLENKSELNSYSHNQLYLKGEKLDLIYADEISFMKPNKINEILDYKKVVPEVKIIFNTSTYSNYLSKIIKSKIRYNDYFIHTQ